MSRPGRRGRVHRKCRRPSPHTELHRGALAARGLVGGSGKRSRGPLVLPAKAKASEVRLTASPSVTHHAHHAPHRHLASLARDCSHTLLALSSPKLNPAALPSSCQQHRLPLINPTRHRSTSGSERRTSPPPAASAEEQVAARVSGDVRDRRGRRRRMRENLACKRIRPRGLHPATDTGSSSLRP